LEVAPPSSPNGVHFATQLPRKISTRPNHAGRKSQYSSLHVASRSPGVSINDVVDDQRIDQVTGTAVLNGTPVDVDLAEAVARA
jgi:hypothetical protein